MQVLETMIPREKIISTDQETTILDAMNILVVNRIGCVVINDESEEVVGIATARDLMSAVVSHGELGLRIKLRDIMSKKLLTVNENDRLSTAIHKMDEYRTHHILVRNNQGKISGILSSSDVVRENSLDLLHL